MSAVTCTNNPTITNYSCCICATRRPDIFPAQQGEIGGISLGLMAYLDPKGEGNNSMPGNRRPCPGAGAARRGARVIWRKLDCLNPNLQEAQSYARRKAPETGAVPCGGLGTYPLHLPGAERCPVRAFKEMSGAPTSRSIRMSGTNVGSPTGREPYGDTVPVVVAGVTACQGGR